MSEAYDLVVIGAGNAGLAAAGNAREAGWRVVVAKDTDRVVGARARRGGDHSRVRPGDRARDPCQRAQGARVRVSDLQLRHPVHALTSGHEARSATSRPRRFDLTRGAQLLMLAPSVSALLIFAQVRTHCACSDVTRVHFAGLSIPVGPVTVLFAAVVVLFLPPTLVGWAARRRETREMNRVLDAKGSISSP